MTPNQRLLDRLIRHKVHLLGYSKHVANRILAHLDATEPAMRRHLLDVFGTSTLGPRLLSRLRSAEARVLGIRGAGWSRSLDEAIQAMVDMGLLEFDTLEDSIQNKLTVEPTVGAINRRVHSALVAGQNLKEWFEQLRAADLRRIVAQLRIAVLGGESIQQILARLMGKLSSVKVAAKRGIEALMTTAVGAVSGAVRSMLVKLNPDIFGWELWVSILDNRTTLGCRDLDGKQFPVGEGPQPGYHLYCRSDRIPLLRDGGDFELGALASWLSTQPTIFRRYVGKKFSQNDLRSLSLGDVRMLDKTNNETDGI